jgi:trehalose 6-phosphate synthase/phosphatase
MEALAHVKFKFSKETKLGENVHIVGSHESLGNWDPQKSLRLFTDPSTYPFWATTMVELPTSRAIEYKYLFVNQDSVVWESLGNRKLFLTQKRVVVEDTDSSSVSKIFYSQSDFNETEDLFDEASKLKDSDSLLILTLSLPVTVRKSSAGVLEFEQTTGVWQSQLYSVLLSRKNEFLWFGLTSFEPETEEERENIEKTMKEKFRCIPVFIESSLLEEHEKYCSMVLYKLLHNIIDLSIEATQCNVSLWTSYKRCNILFSEHMLRYYTGQMIWIHGPQFFLVPSFLSRRTKEIMNIGFFLHHPFPSSEILRMFPYREAILHALCCCDLIGFHLFPYARNFLSCCKRVLGLNVEPTKGGCFGLNYYGRYIMVKSEHIGVQPEIIENLSRTSESVTCYQHLLQKYQDKRIILSIDAAHELAGIHMKFKAFHIAWEKMKHKPLFLQILVPQQTLVENIKIKDQVIQLAEEINKNVGVPIIEIVEKNISNEERYAYMKVSHGLVINCIKDGLCIQPFEYLVIKREKSRIVLSEFTGVSTAVSSPKKVNPFHVSFK